MSVFYLRPVFFCPMDLPKELHGARSGLTYGTACPNYARVCCRRGTSRPCSSAIRTYVVRVANPLRHTAPVIYDARPKGLFAFRGESPGCRLFGTASMFKWLRNLFTNHSQGSSTERWSRNTQPECLTSSGGFNALLYF